MDEKTVKRNIRELRESLGWTQQETADRLGISRTSYRCLESGRTRVISEYLARLAEIMGRSEEELLFGEPLDARVLREGTDWEARLRTLTEEYEHRLDVQRRELENLRALLNSKDETIRVQEQLLAMYRKSSEND